MEAGEKRDGAKEFHRIRRVVIPPAFFLERKFIEGRPVFDIAERDACFFPDGFDGESGVHGLLLFRVVCVVGQRTRRGGKKG